MNLISLFEQRRSIRRYQQIPVTDDQLLSLIRAATLAPCAVNRQGLTYVAVRTPEMLKQIFDLTAWGAAVHPHRTPVWGKTSPAAFIAVCGESAGERIQYDETDAGAAIMSMLLQAVELGLGTCWLGAFDRKKVHDLLELGSRKCLYLVAVGVPAEKPVYEEIGAGVPRKYYLDDSDQLHVPKVRAEELTKFV